MRTCLITLAAMLFSSCAPAQSNPEQDFVRMWSARTNSVRELAEAVNRRFTNGTPVSVVVAALGNNYTRCGSSARLWMGPGPEPPNTTWLGYRFGEEEVTIGSSALFGEDPVAGRFIGAGHSIQVKTTGPVTNRISNGKQDIPANGQPIRSEMNRTSSGTSPTVVYIHGHEVHNQGTYPWHSGMTLKDLIEAAGGLTEFAGSSRIRIIHADGTRDTLFKYTSILSGKANPTLRPGDSIHVITPIIQFVVGYALILTAYTLNFPVYDHMIAVYVLIFGVYALMFAVYDGIFGNYEFISDVYDLIFGDSVGKIAGNEGIFRVLKAENWRLALLKTQFFSKKCCLTVGLQA